MVSRRETLSVIARDRRQIWRLLHWRSLLTESASLTSANRSWASASASWSRSEHCSNYYTCNKEQRLSGEGWIADSDWRGGKSLPHQLEGLREQCSSPAGAFLHQLEGLRERVCGNSVVSQLERQPLTAFLVTTHAAKVTCFKWCLSVCVLVCLEPFEISSLNLFVSNIMSRSSDEFENGCIPMHCGARVVM